MMISESRMLTLDVGQSVRLDCAFYMDNFDMYLSPGVKMQLCRQLTCVWDADSWQSRMQLVLIQPEISVLRPKF